MLKPYIGITGFMCAFDVALVSRYALNSASHRLMVGVLVSSKTLVGLPNKWPGRYPLIDQVAGIFPKDATSLNLIHYNTKEPDTLFEQLLRLVSIGGSHLHGFQLNMVWPDPEVLKEFRDRAPEMKLILQVGSKALVQADEDPAQVASRVMQYKGSIDGVLLDPSGGLGKAFNQEHMAQYLDALAERNLELLFGVAGGLCASTLHTIEGLAAVYPSLCIDAEGKLRNRSDTLDPNECIKYLIRATDIFQTVQR